MRVMLYPPPQLRLLLVVAALLLLGLAVREWRAGFPEQAERLESFDREEPVPPLAPPPPPSAREPRPRRWAASPRPADEPGGVHPEGDRISAEEEPAREAGVERDVAFEVALQPSAGGRAPFPGDRAHDAEPRADRAAGAAQAEDDPARRYGLWDLGNRLQQVCRLSPGGSAALWKKALAAQGVLSSPGIAPGTPQEAPDALKKLLELLAGFAD